MLAVSGRSAFMEKVVAVIQSVPSGSVVSYGQVAAYVGVPRAARQVGRTLRVLEGVDLPWWRVINAEGRITIRGNWHNDKVIQRKLLESEGVQVGDDFVVDMKKYRFIAGSSLLQQFHLSEDYIVLLRAKYGF
jgi:methylated-DNA-protein-cysteine methyltransferase-like protein